MHNTISNRNEYRNDGTFINFFRKEANAILTYLHACINLTQDTTHLYFIHNIKNKILDIKSAI
jgi:hypothetical protein